MKDIFLIAINAKYPHTNLAVRNLKHSLDSINQISFFKEYTINNDLDMIVSDILSKEVNTYCFSCYIWNINIVLNIAKKIKATKENCTIVLGGPEVSYEYKELLNENTFIDYIIRGDGEKAIRDFSKYINGHLDINHCSNLVYKINYEILENPISIDDTFLKAPFPYDDLDKLKSRIVYYEASRGCPYKCAFCLSSVDRNYYEKDIDIVKRDMKIFIDNNTKIVKFVDRTFNANKKRAFDIIEFIAKNSKNTCFHLELSPFLLNEELIEMLSKVGKGLIQVEIGIQSTNKKTLNAIDRFSRFESFSPYIKMLTQVNNIHTHVDLIAGLPYEGLNEFSKSFDDVFSLNAHNVQLGFLKLLKGCKLRNEAEKYGIVYEKKAPYEFIETDFIKKDEVDLLLDIEYLLKRFYNSELYLNSLQYISNKFESAFSMFVYLNDYIKLHKIDVKKLTEHDLAVTLNNCFSEIEYANDFIIYDMLNKRKRPKLTSEVFSKQRSDFAKDYDVSGKKINLRQNLPVKFNIDVLGFINQHKIIKKETILIFDYSSFNDGVKIYPLK